MITKFQFWSIHNSEERGEKQFNHQPSDANTTRAFWETHVLGPAAAGGSPSKRPGRSVKGQEDRTTAVMCSHTHPKEIDL